MLPTLSESLAWLASSHFVAASGRKEAKKKSSNQRIKAAVWLCSVDKEEKGKFVRGELHLRPFAVTRVWMDAPGICLLLPPSLPPLTSWEALLGT